MQVPVSVYMDTPKIIEDPLASKPKIIALNRILKKVFIRLKLKLKNAFQEERKILKIEQFEAEDLRENIQSIIMNSIMDPYLRERIAGFLYDTYEQQKEKMLKTLVSLKITPVSIEEKLKEEEKTKQIRKDLVEEFQNQMKTVAERLFSRIQPMVFKFYHEQAPLNKMVDIISDSINVSKRQVETIARTEIIKILNNARIRSMVENGVKYLQWSAAVEKHKIKGKKTCQLCYELHGNIVKVGDTFNQFIKSKEAQRILRSNIIYSPPAHPNCRCAVRPAITPRLTTPVEFPQEIEEVYKKYPGLDPRRLIMGKIGQIPIAMIEAEELEDWKTYSDLAMREANKWGGELRKNYKVQAREAFKRHINEELELFINDNEELEELEWEHYPISKDEIYTYYRTHWNFIKPRLEGKRIAIRNRKGIMVRNWEPGGKPIKINNTKDLQRAVYQKNAVELIPELNPTNLNPNLTKKLLIDIDPGKNKISKEFLKEIKTHVDSIPNVEKSEVLHTGKRGFHIIGSLRDSIPFTRGKDILKQNVIQPLFEEYKTKIINPDIKAPSKEKKEGKIWMDLSPMKRRGVSILPLSLRFDPKNGNKISNIVQLSEESFQRSLERFKEAGLPLGGGPEQLAPLEISRLRGQMRGWVLKQAYGKNIWKFVHPGKALSPLDNIKNIISKLDIPNKARIQDQTEDLYMKIIKDRTTKGRNPETLAAAAVYGILRSTNIRRPLKDFIKITKGSKDSLIKNIRLLNKNYDLKVPKNFEIEEEIKERATDLPWKVQQTAINLTKDKTFFSKRYGAKGIYEASKIHNLPLSQNYIAKKFNISRSTLARARL